MSLTKINALGKDLEGRRVFSGYAMPGTDYPLHHPRCLWEKVSTVAALHEIRNARMM